MGEKTQVSRRECFNKAKGLKRSCDTMRESKIQCKKLFPGLGNREAIEEKTLKIISNQEDSPGEVHGTPLQYSYLENPKDREA